MKELVILSGKGGTGKTSLAASLALLAGDAVLADCHVDAANLHLVLRPETLRREPFYTGKWAFVNPAQCISCGRCRELCRFEAIRELRCDGYPTQYAVDRFACEGCGVCVHFCPTHAIGMERRTSGEWFVSTTRAGAMVHARLAVAEGNSDRLVARVRREARTLAERNGSRLILVDGPPGTGCPAIASVTGADAALLVAEPGVGPLHDFQRALRLVRRFGVSAYACLNKADIHRPAARSLRRFCRDAAVPLLAEVPFDPVVTEAQRSGRTVVEWNDAPAPRAIRRLWAALEPVIFGGDTATGPGASRGD